MKNKIIGTGHWGPVYARKIDVFKGKPGALVYQYSTNAARTCREAVSRYAEIHGKPGAAYVIRAFFAK